MNNRTTLGLVVGNRGFFPDHLCESGREEILRVLAEEGIESSAVLELNSIHAIKKCVMEGVGISIMPKIAVRGEISKGQLVALKWDENSLETAVLMIWHDEKWISPSLKSFMDMAEKLVNDHQ